eukprot:TRINITY_DN62294_c0_g1_i2.p1 TRINITY_DN62294_c0_g1~~TRINITY_DN62294_c0_g1_i2.p1  ORF type:complete len:274 (-),score=52.04 TRINITY_DN62294_c0_g1_i2:149-970(-)
MAVKTLDVSQWSSSVTWHRELLKTSAACALVRPFGQRKGKDGKKLTFANSIFHRVIPGFIIQAGDITKANGTGGESIYGEKFADENFTIRHTTSGMLSMANAGPNTNNSQFFITLSACPHLDRKHVVFGKVLRGMEVVTRISQASTDSKDFPIRPIVIKKCGQVNKSIALYIPEEEHKEIKTTMDEEKEKEQARKKEEREEMEWFAKQAKEMEEKYKERHELMDDIDRKVWKSEKRKQKMVGVGEKMTEKEEEQEDKMKKEKGIVKKKRRLFF